jgi:hypothetical protein
MVRFGKKASATVDELDQRIGPRLYGRPVHRQIRLRSLSPDQPSAAQPSNIVALSIGGRHAISKTSFGRTARFGNCLPVFSNLAALEGCLSGQGTRSDGLNRCHGRAGLRDTAPHRAQNRPHKVSGYPVSPASPAYQDTTE